MRPILLFAVAVLCTFCTAPIEFDVRPEDSRLVIYSTLTDGFGGAPQRQWVSVQRTLPYFGEATQAWIDGAVVSISDNSTSPATVRPAVWDGETKTYLTADAFAPQPGVTYGLEVLCDFDGDGVRETYTATATALAPAMTISRLEARANGLFGTSMYQLLVWGEDTPGPDSYFYRLAIDGEMRTKTFKSWAAEDDRLFDGSTIEEFLYAVYPGQKNPNDPDPDQIWLEPGQQVTVMYANVEPGFARFVAGAQSSGGNPLFSGPPYNVETNIGGGAIGYFGAVHSSQVSTTVPGDAVDGD